MLALIQRALLYHPSNERVPPALASFPEAREVVLATQDGERIVAWWRPGPAGAAVLVYFHGNGGSLVQRAPRYRAVAEQGFGVLAAGYRGYSGSSGTPSEKGLFLDGAAALDFVRGEAPGCPIVLFGESLGSGVAVALAADDPPDVAALVLECPYTSIADVAERIYPFIPAQQLVTDRFASIERIGRVRVPITILAGQADTLTPASMAQALHDAATAPKTLHIYPGIPHVGTWLVGGFEETIAVLRGRS